MYIGVCKLTLIVAHSESLKEKRMVIRRVKDRVRERLGVAINEVGAQDDRQRAELGVSVTSGDRQKAFELIDDIVKVAMAASDGQIIAIARDVMTYDPKDVATPVVDDRTGSGDKAIAATSDGDWIPDEWRDKLDRE